MAENSKISWTTHTQNLWSGCTKVHAGCDHCYAETLSHRWGNDVWGNDKPRKFIKSTWSDLTKYQRSAEAAGRIDRVFVGSMMDIFEKPMPLIDSKGEEMPLTTGGRRAVFFDFLERDCFPNLDFLLLTKRPSNINKYTLDTWKAKPPKNVMFGTSIVDQSSLKTLLPQLKAVNGRRFLSLEPLLEYLPNLDLSGIDWVIVGGESGHGARPMELAWAAGIKAQCEAQGVAFFFKQTGTVLAKKMGLKNGKGDDISEWPEWLQVQNFPSLPKPA